MVISFSSPFLAPSIIYQINQLPSTTFLSNIIIRRFLFESLPSASSSVSLQSRSMHLFCKIRTKVFNSSTGILLLQPSYNHRSYNWVSISAPLYFVLILSFHSTSLFSLSRKDKDTVKQVNYSHLKLSILEQKMKVRRDPHSYPEPTPLKKSTMNFFNFSIFL